MQTMDKFAARRSEERRHSSFRRDRPAVSRVLFPLPLLLLLFLAPPLLMAPQHPEQQIDRERPKAKRHLQSATMTGRSPPLHLLPDLVAQESNGTECIDESLAALVQLPNLSCLIMPDGKSIALGGGWDNQSVQATEWTAPLGHLRRAFGGCDCSGLHVGLSCDRVRREGGQVRVWSIDRSVQRMLASTNEHKGGCRVHCIHNGNDSGDFVTLVLSISAVMLRAHRTLCCAIAQIPFSPLLSSSRRYAGAFPHSCSPIVRCLFNDRWSDRLCHVGFRSAS